MQNSHPNKINKKRKSILTKNFPHWTAWLKPIILAFGIGIFIYIGRAILLLGSGTSKLVEFFENPTLLGQSILMTVSATILSPIAVTAFIHHYFHLFLNRVLPQIQAPEATNIQGHFPTLVSWWEGCYCWFVMVISFLFAFTFTIPAVPIFDNSWYVQPEYRDFNSEKLGFIFTVLWYICAVFMFNLEYSYKQLVIRSYGQKYYQNPTTIKPGQPRKPNPQSNIDSELEQIRTQLGFHEVKKPNRINNKDQK